MKKSLMLPVALALVLSASAVFAGFSASPDPSGDSMVIILDNAAPGPRVFDFEISDTGRQRVKKEYLIQQGGKQTLYYVSWSFDPNQHWRVMITDGVSGKLVGGAEFNYKPSSRAFTPVSIGPSVRYEAGVGEVSLTITE